jgi:hypothetical protein
MTHPQLTRAHLEATVVAIAAVRPDLRADLCERVDPLRISRAALALLEQLATTQTERIEREELLADRHQDGWVWAETKAQQELMTRVDAITVDDLFFWPLDVLLSLVNQLPERTERPAAWERDLERGTCAA